MVSASFEPGLAGHTRTVRGNSGVSLSTLLEVSAACDRWLRKRGLLVLSMQDQIAADCAQGRKKKVEWERQRARWALEEEQGEDRG